MDINWTNVSHDCIKTLPVILSFVASVMLVKSKLKFSAEKTISLGAYGFGTVIRENVASECANAIVGFSFLLTSIVVQIFLLSFSVRIGDFRGIEKISIPITLAIMFFLLFVGSMISKKLKGKYLKQITEIEMQKKIKSAGN